MGLHVLRAGYEVEAYLLILATWNFANFRYILTRFDLEAFRRVISETDSIFRRLNRHTFETADFDGLARDIKEVYGRFKQLVGQTGASKLLHFKHPGLFAMWDTDIRKRFRVPNHALPDDYVAFLKRMKQEFGHIRWARQDRTLAKAIDEYNFVVAHRDKKKSLKRNPHQMDSGDSQKRWRDGKMGFTTYKNVANPHVTIHRDGCNQIKKHGGQHKYGQGTYEYHKTYVDAKTFATSTHLPVRDCFFCKPSDH